MLPTRLIRSGLRLLVALLIIAVIFFTTRHTHKQGYKSLSETISKYEKFSPFNSQLDAKDSLDFNLKPNVGDYELKPQHEFWNSIFTILNKNRLDIAEDKIDSAIQYIDKSQQREGNSKDALLSKAYISEDVFNEFKNKHEQLLNELPPTLSDSTFKANTDGIVLVGGGRFSWLSYLSLLALREAGSKLPVEIMMPTYNDYEKEQEYCTVLLPKLNAACVVVPDSLGPEVMLSWSTRFKSYQFKSLSLMTSSFQNIFLLDSDNIVLDNPDPLFNSDLFKDNGMIMWPDYWQRTISPVFYDIAGVNVNEKKRVRFNRFPLSTTEDKENLGDEESKSVPYHDLEGSIPNLSTESGQFLINKATHGRTLLLSLYYNIYGPKLFYKLFSLGEQGEGDKDTFVAAATVLKQKFYQLKSFIKTLGYADENGKYQGVAMGQKNPIKDYELYHDKVLEPLRSAENKHKSIKDQIEILEEIMKNSFDSNNDNPVFALHCNYPKLDPLDLISRDNIYDKGKNQLKYRLYGGFSYKKPGEGNDIKIDFELQQWKTIQKVLCKDKLYFRHFEKMDKGQLCKFIKNQVKLLSK